MIKIDEIGDLEMELSTNDFGHIRRAHQCSEVLVESSQLWVKLEFSKYIQPDSIIMAAASFEFRESLIVIFIQDSVHFDKTWGKVFETSKMDVEHIEELIFPVSHTVSIVHHKQRLILDVALSKAPYLLEAKCVALSVIVKSFKVKELSSLTDIVVMSASLVIVKLFQSIVMFLLFKTEGVFTLISLVNSMISQLFDASIAWSNELYVDNVVHHLIKLIDQSAKDTHPKRKISKDVANIYFFSIEIIV